MLVTDSFVFVHIPKTGGSWVRAVVGEHMATVDHRVWKHAAFSELQPEWRHLPVVCIVRNPWDWYVSWFHWTNEWGRKKDRDIRPLADTEKDRWRRLAWEVLLRFGKADFSEAVTRACDFDGADFYSSAIRTIAPIDDPNLTVLRFERLRKQLLRYLLTVGEVSDELEASIRSEPRTRTSAHGPYGDYYDPGLRALVGKRTAWLCERFGYRFH